MRGVRLGPNFYLCVVDQIAALNAPISFD